MSILGKLVYKLFYLNRQKRAIIKKFGGKKSYQEMLDAEQEMKHYALNKLSITNIFNNQGKFNINFLTGEKYIHQSLFCTYSYFKFLSTNEANDFSVNFYNDGSLSAVTLNILQKNFPQINVISNEAITAMLEQHLPATLYPYLNKRLVTQPLFKKLIYPHLNKHGLTIFFDSDMLFMQKPTAFINWLYEKGEIKDRAFGLMDVQRSYGYTDAEILKVWPHPLKNNINSGLYAINSSNMDFEFMESLGASLEKNAGTQYYIEQLITAIILEKTGALTVAPSADYIVLPTKQQIITKAGALHHYVNESKEFYFKTAWKLILQ